MEGREEGRRVGWRKEGRIEKGGRGGRREGE